MSDENQEDQDGEPRKPAFGSPSPTQPPELPDAAQPPASTTRSFGESEGSSMPPVGPTVPPPPPPPAPPVSPGGWSAPPEAPLPPVADPWVPPPPAAVWGAAPPPPGAVVGTQGPQREQIRTSGLGIAAMVVGITAIPLALCLYGLGALVGLVAIGLAVGSFRQIRGSEGAIGGKAFAISGLVCGIVGTVIGIIWGVIIVMLMVASSSSS